MAGTRKVFEIKRKTEWKDFSVQSAGETGTDDPKSLYRFFGWQSF